MNIYKKLPFISLFFILILGTAIPTHAAIPLLLPSINASSKSIIDELGQDILFKGQPEAYLQRLILKQLKPVEEKTEVETTIEAETTTEQETTTTATSWYTTYSVIAHAMGSVNGVDYTNSKEAFEQSYKKGYRVFEIDLSFTSDNRIVLWHDWEEDTGKYVKQSGRKIPTYEFFMSHKICKKYTPLSLEDLIDIMESHPDIYVVTDSKETNYLSILKSLVKESKEDDTILNRFIIQFYEYDQYAKIQKVYSFKNCLFTIYNLRDRNLDHIGSFCKENKVPVVGVPPKYAGNKRDVAKLKEYGVYVYTYTINKPRNARFYKQCGIDGIYTDSITEF